MTRCQFCLWKYLSFKMGQIFVERLNWFLTLSVNLQSPPKIRRFWFFETFFPDLKESFLFLSFSKLSRLTFLNALWSGMFSCLVFLKCPPMCPSKPPQNEAWVELHGWFEWEIPQQKMGASQSIKKLTGSVHSKHFTSSMKAASNFGPNHFLPKP